VIAHVGALPLEEILPSVTAAGSVVGLVAAAFISNGGVAATLAGDGFNATLGDPDEIGGFVGAIVQVAGLAFAPPAGVVAARTLRSRAETRVASAGDSWEPRTAAPLEFG
jgi:hypothetical protein